MNEWTLEKDYPALEQGYVGAIQKEVLYLFNPASFYFEESIATRDYRRFARPISPNPGEYTHAYQQRRSRPESEKLEQI
jgi:hypothetical protein